MGVQPVTRLEIRPKKKIQGCSQRTTAPFHHLGISKLAKFWEPEDNWRTVRPCHCCIWQALPPAIKHGESWQVRKIPVRKCALIILWDIIRNIMGYIWHINGIWLAGWWFQPYPSEKWWSSSVGMTWHSQLIGKIKNGPNHQPDMGKSSICDWRIWKSMWLIARAKQKWFPFEQNIWSSHEHGHLWGFPHCHAWSG